jgi:ribosomal protein S18 acetylase RimI-like enzyme
MEIGRISEEDLAALAELYQQLQPNEPSVAKMRETLLAVEQDPNHIIIGARIDGKLVGSALGIVCQMLFGQCKSFMIIEDVVVDSEHRRDGVGTALMLEMEKLAVQQNCGYIMLITDEDRTGAQNFYKSLGYKSDSYRAFKKKL